MRLKRRSRDKSNSILVSSVSRIRDWVMNLDEPPKCFEVSNDIDHLAITYVWDIFFECEPKDGNRSASVSSRRACHEHSNALSGNPRCHRVVDPTASKDHLRMISDLLSSVREIIGVDSNAVPPDEAGVERKKIPLRSSSGKHIAGIDIEAVKDGR